MGSTWEELSFAYFVRMHYNIEGENIYARHTLYFVISHLLYKFWTLRAEVWLLNTRKIETNSGSPSGGVYIKIILEFKKKI